MEEEVLGVKRQLEEEVLGVKRQLEEEVLGVKRQLEDGDLNLEQKVFLLNNSLNKALQTDGGVLVTAVRSRLYLGGLLSHCVPLMTQYPRMQRENWAALATLAQLTRYNCLLCGGGAWRAIAGFHRLFLPSVMDGLLSLAAQLMRREQCVSLFRKVMDSVCLLLRSHPQLTTQVLSSERYEQIQMCEDDNVTLLCVQMWIHTCTGKDFLSELSDDSALLLLNEAVGQLAVSSASSVGGASVRLILLMANQQEARVKPLLLSFRGLDSLLDKDWRGRGFDQEVDQLIAIIQSDARILPQACSERVRAACLIQAAWRSFQTRRRLRSLNRAVCKVQRRYRSRRRQQRQHEEEQRGEEELRFQVCVRRQQARRKFHQKQRQLLQLLPPDQVQWYLQECERRAAVVIQSYWRGFRERRRYNTHTHTLRHTHTQQHAARTLQRAVRLFLQKRRAAKIPPTSSLWIGQEGLTDSRRAELQRQLDQQVSLLPVGSGVSRQEFERLHQEVHLMQRGNRRLEALLAHTHTQLEKLREAPPLSVVTATEADSFLSPSGPIAARARDSHNTLLQAGRLPWWRTGGDDDSFSPAPLQGLEAELGGLFVGGQIKI